MQTWLVGAHAPLEIDALIVQALRPSDNNLAGGGVTLNLGILALDGQVYRIARAWDLKAYRRATEDLEALGLVNTGRRLRLSAIGLDDVFRWIKLPSPNT